MHRSECAVGYVFLKISDVALHLVRRARGIEHSSARWRTQFFSAWSRGLCRILGMRIDVRGRPPQPPFFLVANHLGYIDVLLLASQLPCVFVARSDVERWPVVGRLCRAVNTLFVDRTNKRDLPRVMSEIERTFDDGRGVVVFPEGTSTKGANVQRFKPSLLESAARAGWPVSFASLSYRTFSRNSPAHLSVCWWGDMGFGRHLLQMLGLPGFQASLVFGEEPIRERDRKLLAE